MRRFVLSLAASLVLLGSASDLYAQQRIGYVDSQRLLEALPEYQSVQKQLDRLAADWREELEEREREVESMFREYQSRELLYTEQERRQRREEIVEAERELEELRRQYFGPEGELFARQEELVRPLQERILEAVEVVAEEEDYDYVLDQTGSALFMYATDDHDLTERVLDELDVDAETNRSR